MHRKAIGLFVVSVLAACSSATDAPPNPGSVSAVIGPAGGNVVSHDGKLTLNFPAGALSTTTTISIARRDTASLGPLFGGLQVAGAYELGPSGLTFATPITGRLRIRDVPLPAADSVTLPLEVLLTVGGDSLEQLDSLRVESSEGGVFLVGRLRHFSPLVRSLYGGTVMLSIDAPDEAELDDVFETTVRATDPGGSLVGGNYVNRSPLDPNAVAIIGPQSGPMGTFADGVVESVLTQCIALGEGLIRIHVELVLGGGPDLDYTIEKRMTCTPHGPRTLIVHPTGTGGGSVTSVPAGIACTAHESDCDEPYPYGTAVTLTATADPDSYFAWWDVIDEFNSTCGGGTENVLSVIMNAARTCYPRFNLSPQLTVTSSGAGTGEVSSDPEGITACGTAEGDCSGRFPPGTEVTLTANPGSGSHVATWTGACSGTGESTKIIMGEQDAGCGVQFELDAPDPCTSTETLTYGTPTAGSWGPGACVRDSRYVVRYLVTTTQLASAITVSSTSTRYVRVLGTGTDIRFGDPSGFTGTQRVFLPVGQYVIEVMRSAAATGTFTITVALTSELLENCQFAQTIGSFSSSQALSSGDCNANALHSSGSGAQEYDGIYPWAKIGSQVTVTMSGTEFPLALIVIHIAENGTQTPTVNSNSGNATSISLSYTVQPGTYCIIFISRGANNGPIVGAYAFTVTVSG